LSKGAYARSRVGTVKRKRGDWREVVKVKQRGFCRAERSELD
jgi:hypothetical protein